MFLLFAIFFKINIFDLIDLILIFGV